MKSILALISVGVGKMTFLPELIFVINAKKRFSPSLPNSDEIYTPSASNRFLHLEKELLPTASKIHLYF